MEGRVLQPWVTVRAEGDGLTIIQGEPFWLDVGLYRDIIAWLDVREVTHPGALKVRCNYQTSPTRDDALFILMGSPIELATGTVTVTQMLGSISAPPLGKYFRWKLDLSGSSANKWNATFRILVALNRPGYRTPTYLTTSSKEMTSVEQSTMFAPQQGGGGGDSTYLPVPIKNP